MNNNKLLVLVLCVAVAGFAFIGGVKYNQMQKPQNGNGGNLRQGGQRNFAGGSSVRGSIISADSGSITIKLQDGSSKIVLLSQKTTINKATAGVFEDLKAGENVMVFGTANTDGSVTATNVQLNPNFGGPEGGNMTNTNQKSADAKEYVVTGANYSFSPITLTVKKGEKSRIVFKNMEGMHDFVVDELKIKTATIQAGQEDFVEFTADKAGTYEFYCSVGNHRAMGMKGTLTVTE